MRRAPNKPLPSQERLRELLDYDPESGVFTWKTRGNPNFDKPNAGRRAGSLPAKAKYREMYVDNRSYLEHRIVWRYVTGEDPGADQIDHRDTKTDNNRFANLRRATHATNQQNTRKRSTASNPYKGANWNATKGRWQSYIKVDGKSRFLGLFDSPEDAHAAYVRAAKIHFGEFARHD